MSLVLSEEQEILQRTVREFVNSKSSMKRIRTLRDDRDGDGFSKELWREMAQLGWLGIVVPEEYGGSGLGFGDLMVVMEELGRGLMPEPMIATALLGTQALLLGGTDAQKKAHLPAIVSGERLVALAYQEPKSRYAVDRVDTRAERAGNRWRLTGEKVHVLDGHTADTFVVSAKAPDGVTLFLVPRDAKGLAVERQHRIDGRGTALVHLAGVEVGDDAVLGGVGKGAALLERVVDRATIALTAEMLGGMTAAFEMTLAYLKTRVQFGVLIGTFQALKHRAARLFIETELTRSVVMAAHTALDDGADDTQIARLAGVAKARSSDAYLLIGNEAVQMHGGIGMTDEHDIGFYLKRSRTAAMTFGDGAWHRDRVARLDGY